MIFLDLVGTITDCEKERRALLSIGEEIKSRFSLSEGADEIWNSIDSCRRPAMDSRDVKYVPIRDLISECLRKFLHVHGIEMSREDELWVKELYISAHERYSELSERAGEGLKIMREISDSLGLISDADDDYLERVLKALGITDIFDSITSSEEAGVGKPNTEIFKLAMKKSGKADIFYYIGDSERRDIKGSKKAGMVPILISQRDVKSEAKHIAKNLYEAAIWIKNRENLKDER